MEPKGSSPSSQEPATCPYPEPNESNPPNLISIFRALGRSKVSVQFRGHL
jgi:hypothetical protein